MKTTNCISFLLLFIISSFVNGQTKKQVSEFENILGKENYITLNILTTEFEKDILNNTYPTLSTEKAYKKFLTDVKNGKFTYWNKISPKSRNIFKNSDLRLEVYEFPDSVWIGKKGIESRYVFDNKDGTIDYGFSLKSADLNKNLDSLIQNEYNTPRLKYTGKYLEAIRTIKNGNQFLETFYDVKDKAGYIQPEIMASMLLEEKPDFTNPITKGLIVIEFGY